MSTPNPMLRGTNHNKQQRSLMRLMTLLVAPVLLLTLFAVSCGGAATPTPAPTPTPVDIEAITASLQDSVEQAIQGLKMPDSLSGEDVREMINTAVSDIDFPEGLTADEVKGLIDTAISGIDIPEGVTTEQMEKAIRTAVDEGVQRAVAEATGGSLTIYSAREETLVGPIIQQFEDATGIEVGVKYGSNSGLAATIQEEGANSPADIFFATDPGLLGSMSDLFTGLPRGILDRVDSEFRSREDKWVGISGRARVVVYNPDVISADELPDSILDFTDPEWNGRIGWPPTNGSFQAFVTAMRTTLGEDAARDWLEGIQANDPRVYPKNTPIVDAVSRGEVDVGFVNHYYLYRFLAEHGEDFQARNYHPKNGDIGAMMLVNGAAILSTSDNTKEAERFLGFMLSLSAQQYFASQTFEYPLIQGVRTHRLLTPLDEIDVPDVDLSQLDDVQGTQDLLRSVGIIP